MAAAAREPTLDFSTLEEAARRVGLGEVAVVVVPPARRRAAWFAWGPGELRVSERVLERLAPGDAQALLAQTVLERRRRRALRGPALLAALVEALALWFSARAAPAAVGWFAAGAALLTLVLAAVVRAWTAVAADDETVRLLGSPEALCRALNGMSGGDELRVAGGRWPARPDLHARAERLVRRHQLLLPPGRRSVPPLGAEPPTRRG